MSAVRYSGVFVFVHADAGIRDSVAFRGLGDVFRRQGRLGWGEGCCTWFWFGKADWGYRFGWAAGVGRWLLILVLGWEGVLGFSVWLGGWGGALPADLGFGAGLGTGVLGFGRRLG